jgi:hypothetical protein
VIDWSCRLLVGTFCETLRAFAPFLGEVSLFFSSFPPFSKTRAPMHKTWAAKGRCCLCGVSCLRVTVLSLRGFCVGVTRRQQRLWAHVTSRNRPGLLWLTSNAYTCRIFLWSSRFSSCLKPKKWRHHDGSFGSRNTASSEPQYGKGALIHINMFIS